MLEKRRFQRYDLQLEASISVYDDQVFKKTEKGMTRDISAGGAFVQSSSKYPVGTSLYVEVYLPVNSNAGNIQSSKLQGQGCVIRNTPLGFAVSFDANDCDLVPETLS
ncbi:MAG: PilZ domain-containing protein [Desulfovermiculus sp.]|nr:PilZ domain-containing protein [Desulfovermiculus sp.]